MRENMGLFRGRRTDNGEWVYGFFVILHDFKNKKSIRIYPGYAETDCGDFYPAFYKVDFATVGECTGLRDKNGTLIFEGDVIFCTQDISGNWIDQCVEIGYVEMKYGAFGLHRKQGYYRPFKDWLEDYEYEVIGNIHDNPELVGGIKNVLQ